jgi:hypothetical protein
MIPGIENNTYYAFGSGLMFRAPLLGMLHTPGSAEAGYLRHFFANEMNVSSSNMNETDGEFAWMWFLANDPTIAPVTPPKTAHFTTTPRTTCIAIWTAANCPTNEQYYKTVSKSGFTTASTYFAVDLNPAAYRDHAGTPFPSPGWTILAKNGRVLLGNDSSAYYAERERRNYLEVGGNISNRKTYSLQGNATINWDKATDNYSVVAVDIAPAFITAANVSGAYEKYVHIKNGTQDWVIVAKRATLSSAGQMRDFQHYPLCQGTPNATTAISFSSSAKTVTSTCTSPNARILSKTVGFGGVSVLQVTEDGNDTHGNYTGSGSTTFRTTTCPTTNGTTCNTSLTAFETATLYKPIAASTGSLPSTAESSSGIFRIWEIQDATSPAIACWTGDATTGSTVVTMTVTQNGTYLLCNGLTGGKTYTVQSGGVNVSGCVSLTVTTGENTLGCANVPAGTVTITESGVSLNIDQTTLPGGTVGVAYSQTLTATGGAGSNVWDVSSGTLCSGLSMSAGGAITGTPSTAQTCSFTARVTDSASATDTQALSITIAAPGVTGTGVGVTGQATITGQGKLQ